MPLEERACLFPAAAVESVPHRLPNAPPSLPKVYPEDVLRRQTETRALGLLISRIKQRPCHGNATQFLKEVYFKDKSQELPALPQRLGSARRGPSARQMAAPPGAAGAAGAAGPGRAGAGRGGEAEPGHGPGPALGPGSGPGPLSPPARVVPTAFADSADTLPGGRVRTGPGGPRLPRSLPGRLQRMPRVAGGQPGPAASPSAAAFSR